MRQDCGKDRSIPGVEINDARARIRTANRIVAKKIQDRSILEWRTRTGVPKFQCRQSPIGRIDAIAEFSYCSEGMANHLRVWPWIWCTAGPVGIVARLVRVAVSLPGIVTVSVVAAGVFGLHAIGC